MNAVLTRTSSVCTGNTEPEGSFRKDACEWDIWGWGGNPKPLVPCDNVNMFYQGQDRANDIGFTATFDEGDKDLGFQTNNCSSTCKSKRAVYVVIENELKCCELCNDGYYGKNCQFKYVPPVVPAEDVGNRLGTTPSTKQNLEDKSGSQVILPVSIAIIGLLIVGCTVVVVFFCYRRRIREETVEKKPIETDTPNLFYAKIDETDMELNASKDGNHIYGNRVYEVISDDNGSGSAGDHYTSIDVGTTMRAVLVDRDADRRVSDIDAASKSEKLSQLDDDERDSDLDSTTYFRLGRDNSLRRSDVKADVGVNVEYMAFQPNQE